MTVIPKLNWPCEDTQTVSFRRKTVSISETLPARARSVFCQRIEKIGMAATVEEHGFLCYKEDVSLPEEGYILEIGENRVIVHAAGEAGANYGLTTLFQMIAQGELPVGTFRDHPRFGYRGFSLDTCRHFFTTEEVKRILEQAALLKLNRMHWHLSDDQAFRVESRKFPRLNSVGSHNTDLKGNDISGYYTWEEIQNVVAFAADRGVEIIPEMDLPGHSRAIQVSYPKLTCRGDEMEMGTFRRIEESLLCPGKDGTLEFLKELLAEWCGLFPGKLFHIGGDEAPKQMWKECPHCQERIQKEGLADEEQLQSWMMNNLAVFLESHGKTAVCWDDCFTSGTMKPGIVAQYWNDMDRRGHMNPELAKGRKMILSNLHCFYSNYGYGLSPMARTYGYEPFLPTAGAVPAENLLGIECTVWAEEIYTPEELEFYLFPRLCAAAEAAWTAEKDMDSFRERLKAYKTIFEAFGIHAASGEKVFPEGEELRQAVIRDGLRMDMIGSPEEVGKGLTQESQRRLYGWLAHMTRGYYSEETVQQILQSIS